MISLIPIAYRWGIVALVAAAFGGWCYTRGLLHGERELEAFREAVAVEGAKQAEHNLELVNRQQAITQRVSNDYQAKIAALQRKYASWVPVRPDGGEVSRVSCSAESADAKPPDLVSVADYRTLAELCAQTTQQLVSLQGWLKEVRRE